MIGAVDRVTDADAIRFQRLRGLGCIACQLGGVRNEHRHLGGVIECHHLLSGGRRRGHEFTVPLCEWHHRGVFPLGMRPGTLRILLGPSLAEGSKPYRERYGGDDATLAATNRLLLARYGAEDG